MSTNVVLSPRRVPRYRFTEVSGDRKARTLRIEGEDRNTVFVDSTTMCLLVRYRDDSSVAERVSAIFRRNLKRPMSLEDVAETLAISPQTLRRRLLEEEQCGFQEIKDRVRRDIATHMLKKSRLPLEEIALSLGFSELSTFHRAFRRWTGLTPGEFRERHAAAAGAR